MAVPTKMYSQRQLKSLLFIDLGIKKYTKKYKEMFGENLMTDPYQFMSVLEELENEFIDLLKIYSMYFKCKISKSYFY